MATYQDSRYNIALPSGSGGAIVPIKTLTASSSATLSFVDGSSDVVLDNTYRTYVFKFIGIHPATNNASLTFQGNAAGGSGYNETMTTTWFYAGQNEAGTSTYLSYGTGADQAQGTSFQAIGAGINDNADDNTSGELWLFNPSSTTFVKHYLATVQGANASNYTQQLFTGGYMNTTSAVDAIQFSFQSGNIDSGVIKLYGIKDS